MDRKIIDDCSIELNTIYTKHKYKTALVKIIILKVWLMLVVLIVISCQNNNENSIENDAKKLVKLEFKIKKINENARAGDMFMKEEVARLVQDTIVFVEQMMKKYSSFSDKQKFYKAFSKEKNEYNFFNR